MSVASLTGSDTIIINSLVLTNFADGNVCELDFPNDLTNVKTGKNGNAIYAFNATGLQCEVKLRVIRGSSDDKFLNNLITQQRSNLAGFTLMIGQFVKKVGDGAGNITSDTYIMSGGIFSKQAGAKSNVEGDTEQSITMYTMKFSNSPRAIT
jgi:hypothetical protein